jgi:hypothetical protein
MAEMKLTEEELDGLRVKHGKIAVVEWNEHAIVFRKPTRDECRAYRVALESPATKADALEQICQRAIVAFDGERDANKARTTFTGSFLEDVPMFASTAKVKIAMGALMGVVEEEDLLDLGKGVTIRPSPRPRTPTG